MEKSTKVRFQRPTAGNERTQLIANVTDQFVGVFGRASFRADENEIDEHVIDSGDEAVVLLAALCAEAKQSGMVQVMDH